jgi:hypothetical protein
MSNISIQTEFCRPLSNYKLPKAVLRQEQELLELDELIKKVQLDLEFLNHCQSDPSLRNRRPEKLLYHLKLTLLQRLRPCSDRDFEALVSRNEAMHQFLGISKLDEASTRPPSRSSICRSRQMFSDVIIEAFTRRITEQALQRLP